MDCELQQASAGDVTILAAIMGEFYAEDGFAFDEKLARQAFSDLIASPHYGRVWLIRADGETAGYIVLTFSFTMEFCGRDGYIDDFFIRPAFRRRGLGREVLRRVEDAARREGVKVLFLEAHDEIKPHLINFYEWAGYARRPCRLMRKCL